MNARADRWVAFGLAAAVLAQGVALVLLGRLGARPAVQVVVAAAALALVVREAWTRRMGMNHRIDMLLVMGALGGLGMLAGWWVDLGFTAPPADASFHVAMGHAPADGSGGGACCAHPGGEGGAGEASGGSFWPMVTTWMTGLMLVFAIPPGVVLTRCAQLARSGRRLWISTHLVGNAAMVAGMIVVGHWIGPALGRLAGSNVVGAHLGMLGGMLLGMEAGMLSGEALLGLAPWREWSWGGGRQRTPDTDRSGPAR